MSNPEDDRLPDAARSWQQGEPLVAGRLIFENLPNDLRVAWASDILKLALRRGGVRFAPIDDVLRIAQKPLRWKDGHRAFDKLRRSTLALEGGHARSDEDRVILHQLYLAENVANVIYNATDPRDAFDEDSGWWVVACLRDLVDFWKDDEFAGAAWLAVCCREQ
jgi:hypothetical protein